MTVDFLMLMRSFCVGCCTNLSCKACTCTYNILLYGILVTWHDHSVCSLHNIISFFHCSFVYSHRNVFGRNQKLNISLERGQIDSILRINYIDPWIEGDDKQTSRTMMVQVCYGFCFIKNNYFLGGAN